MGYDEIYETFLEVSKEHINRDLFNHSTDAADETIEDIKNNKIAIYTAFTGDYDTLKQPEFIDENCDYICFTDNPDLESDLWTIIQMEESVLDNNRKAKQYKLLPHKYLRIISTVSGWTVRLKSRVVSGSIFTITLKRIHRCWLLFTRNVTVFMKSIRPPK